jgi:cytidyltransferase-like protein
MDKPIIWTVGRFDILHPGHVRFLEQARDLGAALIVGVVSDAFCVTVLGRQPVNPWPTRMRVVGALRVVDATMMVEDVDFIKCLEKAEADVFAFGAEHQEDRFAIAAAWMKKSGKEFVAIPRTPGYSTSAVLNKILTRGGHDGC